MFKALKLWVKRLFKSHKPAAPAPARQRGVPEPVTLAKTAPQRPAEQRYKRILIPLYSGPGDPPPGHWKQCAPSTVHRFKAELTCPYGHGMTLKGHTVAANGLVSPSVVCHSGRCSFHEFVSLQGWSHGAVK